MTKEISTSMIDTFSDKVRSAAENKVMQDAIMKNGIKAATLNGDAVVSMNPVFSEEIETGKVTDQKQSGRCWMFAALNTFRHKFSDAFHIKDFELSQNYTLFWDKFEKANYFLESILNTAAEPLDGRLVSWLMDTPQQDGGQWDMLVAIIEKYGVVPKQAMPETFQSSRTPVLNQLLNARLREDAGILRVMSADGKSRDALEAVKTEMLGDIYRILAFSLGEPPKVFDFEYRDEDKKFHRDLGITPQEFFKKYIGLDLNDYVAVINAPTQDKPYKKTYTVQYLGTVVGGHKIKYLNVDMETLKSLAVSQIKANESVWFGCDVGQYSDNTQGIMDTSLFDFDAAFGTKFKMTKAERLDYKHSCLTHAMVLTGVNLVDGKPNRWKVENSWGEKWGTKGYFVMSDRWMDEYTYQVVINKKYLSDELKAAFEQEPIELKPWDPMGALAVMQ
ncbi:C1 family peptidase [Sporolactobacillus shoreicorticis]|uniref:Aminopeptidase n=1 Tax=Sporolactobacillus shoreicorticis TaxID=1923877 RepID=A0ABW5S4R7_9BACL|nr:C1 family peptidase [Sporolactobacillus shoreicorticis]MCO7127183.1 C1 family peptidase [Sporolactobacillus shoreicorticis]